jgi:hypothetical protein
MLNENNKIEFVVTNFHNLEKQLIDCLDYIPYIDQNFKLISPKFIPLILESCSLIESIFKLYLGDKKQNFKEYADSMEDQLNLEETISIFLVTPLQYLQPFKNWKNIIPEWWNVYNKLKHDRLNNYHLVNFESVIKSLTALHQVISKSDYFFDNIIERGWINPESKLIPELISSIINQNGLPIEQIACESELFVSPHRGNFVREENNCFLVDYVDFSNRVKIKISFDEYW